MSFVAVTIALAVSTVLPLWAAAVSTACDSAIANPDLHFPREMPREDGTRAFTYGSDSTPFVAVAGNTLTVALALTFDPDGDTTIKLAALNAECGGGNSSGAVFEYSFSEITRRQNTMVYDMSTGATAFNDGDKQTAVPMGTPRYVWIEVWDGNTPSNRSGYSYLVDLQHPETPVSR